MEGIAMHRFGPRHRPEATKRPPRLAPAALVLAALGLALLAGCAPSASTPRNPSTSDVSTTFVGVGVALHAAEDDGRGALVVGVLPDSPALRMGVPVTDPPARLIAVDGADVRDLQLRDIVARIEGPAGQPVTLSFALAGGGTRTFTLVRKRLAVPSPAPASP
jgi:hypothetical protein